MPIHIAPTYREFRESDEMARIRVPAETHDNRCQAGANPEHPPGVAKHQGIQAERDAEAVGQEHRDDHHGREVDRDDTELSREVVKPPDRP